MLKATTWKTGLTHLSSSAATIIFKKNVSVLKKLLQRAIVPYIGLSVETTT